MWFERYGHINFVPLFQLVICAIVSHFNFISTDTERENCEHNSSNSVLPIFLKLCMCLIYSQVMCMWFDIIITLNFYIFRLKNALSMKNRGCLVSSFKYLFLRLLQVFSFIV